MQITIRNLQSKVRVNIKDLKEIVARALKIEGKDQAEVSILLVDNATIKDLNRRYKGLNRATDVLAFSQQEGESGFLKINSNLLGDVVVSINKALTQSRKYKQSFKKELYLYIIHGCLHLLGYDDINPLSRKRMEKKQKEILRKIELEGLCG
ncbi:MAG: rRNA maturation RNase YbeY [Candidatus Omnitrophota bacterium]|nr:rRNA maturation RNase YbeY [Candidatus Omnitrophota bacterium]